QQLSPSAQITGSEIICGPCGQGQEHCQHYFAFVFGRHGDDIQCGRRTWWSWWTRWSWWFPWWFLIIIKEWRRWQWWTRTERKTKCWTQHNPQPL
ncbi:hypothetical protein BGZ95_000985, partial [Linnemannia exigua]